MTLPNLVSFSGQARSGTDSAADLLVARVRFVKTYMAKPLEKTLLQANPWIVDYAENTIERFADLHAKLGFDATREFEEVRRLLQMGTDIGRNILGKNVWSDLVFEEVRSYRQLGKSVAVAGVKHPDELAIVRKLDGVCVWIERESSRPNDTVVKAEDCDLAVHNNGTLKDLYVNLITALEEYNTEDMEIS